MIEKVIERKRLGERSLHVRRATAKPLGIELIRLSIQHGKLIGAIVAGALLGSIIFTMPWFMPPKYLSEAIIYPPSSNTSSSLINSDMRFGSDRDIDNAMQVLQSGILQDSIVRKYRLMEHYGIDPNSSRKYYELSKEYGRNISIDRTRYNSIAVRVLDTDPKLAADIANDIVKIGDAVKAEIIMKNLRSAYQTADRELRDKTNELNTLRDSMEYVRHKNYIDALALLNNHYDDKKQTVNSLLSSLENVRNEHGIYDLNQQYNAIYNTYLQANATYTTDSGMVEVMKKYLSANDTSLIRRKAEMEGTRILANQLKAKMTSLNHTGNQFNTLQENYNMEKNVLSAIKGDYEFSQSTFEKEYSNISLNTLKDKYAAELSVYNTLKTKYELVLSNLTDHVPTSYVISPAVPSEHKESPKRLLITALVGLSAYALCILFILLSKNLQTIRTSIKD